MNNNEYGTKLAKDTLTGDIATFLIDRVRQFPKPYRQMSEREQVEQIEMAKRAAETLVAEAVKIIASGGRKTVPAELGKITVDKGLKAEIKANISYADELISVAGKPILIVTNSDDEFTGGGENLKADPDQREMFNNCNSEYEEADGMGIPDPEQTGNEVLALPTPEVSNITEAEFEEIDSTTSEDGSENEENSDAKIDSSGDEFAQAEQEFADEKADETAA